MNEIDKNVTSALNELTNDGDQSVRVLISCREGSCDQLALELMTEGAEVKQVISELDILLVEITSMHLKFLESSEHVHAVELDQDVDTQLE